MGDSPPIAIEGLTKRLTGGVLALDGVDLVVEQGQVLGLAGPNGAGKSVTLKVLLGLVRPTSGSVRLYGEPIRSGAPVLARVGALVDGPGFVPHLSGLENLRLALRMTHERPRRRRVGANGHAGAEAHDEARLGAALELAGLGTAIERPFKTYSHGMRYRLGLAQAMMGEPDLLLLDEPTTGLDPAHILEIRAAIASAAAAGTTVVFSSHQLAEVQRVCTHVAVMRAGRLVAHGTVAELKGAHGSLEDAYLGLLGGPAGHRTDGAGAGGP